MKIALASEDGKTLAGHVGHARFFYVFSQPENMDSQTELKPLEILVNRQDRRCQHGNHERHSDREHRGNHEHCGNHGQEGDHEHHDNNEGPRGEVVHNRLASLLAGVEVMLCKTCGYRLSNDLEKYGIKVLGVSGRDLEKVARDFFLGTAKVRENPSCGRHHH